MFQQGFKVLGVVPVLLWVSYAYACPCNTDVNGDGIPSVGDISTALLCIQALPDPPMPTCQYMDVDCDGEITPWDGWLVQCVSDSETVGDCVSCLNMGMPGDPPPEETEYCCERFAECHAQPEWTPCGEGGASVCEESFCDGLGLCLPADGIACPDDGNDCTDDVCSEGVCTHPALPDYTICETDQVCLGGYCGGREVPTTSTWGLAIFLLLLLTSGTLLIRKKAQQAPV